MIKTDSNILSEIIGLTVEGIHHDYVKKDTGILLEGSIMLLFKDCVLVYDGGIIGDKIIYASEYSGEMGFVLDFRERKLNVEDYKFAILKGAEDEFPRHQIRIAYKSIEVRQSQS